MPKGDRIRELRKSKGITQEELAKLLSTTKQTISKYEKGIVTNIPSDRVEAMAKILDTTPEYILGWEETKKPATTITLYGLSAMQKRLVDFTQRVPDDKADMILRVITILPAKIHFFFEMCKKKRFLVAIFLV